MSVTVYPYPEKIAAVQVTFKPCNSGTLPTQNFGQTRVYDIEFGLGQRTYYQVISETQILVMQIYSYTVGYTALILVCTKTSETDAEAPRELSGDTREQWYLT